MTSLISISDLIHESWTFFKQDWKAIVKRNLWLLPITIAYIALDVVGNLIDQSWLSIVGAILLSVGTIGVTIHVMRYLLARDGEPKQASEGKPISELILPAIIISLITMLGILGGSILFLIPGIWFGIAASFGLIFFLEEGTTGTKAISQSMHLVKGRWWMTLWRTFVPSLVFQLILGVISLLTFVLPIILFVAGGAGAIAALYSGSGSNFMSAASLPLLIIAGILFILALIVNFGLYLVLISLREVTMVKLFHSLKASR